MPPNQDKPVLKLEEGSFPDLVYPGYRNDPVKDGYGWLLGKVECDKAEGLWRIHDELYDFTDFIEKHPGGSQWLRLTKGTDITEAFECHHISTYPKSMLSKFHIRTASQPRYSPFTFKEDGFYKTLQRRVREELKNVPKGLEKQSKDIIDRLIVGVFVSLIFASRVEWMPAKIVLTLITSLFIAWTTVAAHNFTHLKDNWRMYFYNLNFLSSSEWRVTHALSHHLFPNTMWDYELYSVEPFLNWQPWRSKSNFMRFAPIFYSVFLLYPMTADSVVFNRLYRIFNDTGLKLLSLHDLIGFSIPITIYFFGTSSFLITIFHWIIIVHVTSFIISYIGFNSAHHHPDIFHDGDPPAEDLDWGLHQLSAIMEREDINASFFLVLTRYGNHVLHHMFPTLDHAYLPYLNTVLYKTCEEFNAKVMMSTQFEMTIGQFQQIARNVPCLRTNFKNST